MGSHDENDRKIKISPKNAFKMTSQSNTSAQYINNTIIYPAAMYSIYNSETLYCATNVRMET